MAKISNVFIKTSKLLMGLFGTVVIGSCLGVGIYTKVYEQENKSFINSQIEQLNGSLDTVSNTIDKISSSSLSSVEELKKLLTDSVGTIETQVKEQVNNAQNLVNQLKSEIQTETNEQIKQVYQKALVQAEQIVAQVKDMSGQIRGFVNQIQNAVNIDDIKRIVQQVESSANEYIGIASDALSKIPPEKVNKYYDQISNITLGIGLSVLGLTIFGILISFIFYKNVDGKMVGRLSTKKELEKHLKKILVKNPGIVEELRRRQ